MKKVGLTGGIGSGKSTIAKIFSTLGVSIFDADAEAKFLMSNNQQLQREIKYIFGEEIYTFNTINRTLLASKIFGDQRLLRQLNQIVHPALQKHWQNWIRKQSGPYVIKEAAILFESGTAIDLDVVIGIYAPEDIRIARVMQRNNITREEVVQRINNQIDDNIKMKLCDFVVYNDEQSSVVKQILEIHNKIIFH